MLDSQQISPSALFSQLPWGSAGAPMGAMGAQLQGRTWGIFQDTLPEGSAVLVHLAVLGWEMSCCKSPSC